MPLPQRDQKTDQNESEAKVPYEPWLRITPEWNEPEFPQASGEAGRHLTYAEAIREALDQALTLDPRVFIMGQGVDDPSGMFGATLNLHQKHGADRVFDTPLSEDALMGTAVGAAIGGMRPVYFHNRPDFLLLAMNQLVNHASKWHYMFGGAVNIPMVVWACIGRGWGSAAQHSQALQGLFMHVPGLKLVMPSICYDAKGLMLSAIADDNPVLILEHRYNFKHQGFVPEHVYRIPFGKGVVRRPGKDVTLVAISYMTFEAYKAAEELEGKVLRPKSLIRARYGLWMRALFSAPLRRRGVLLWPIRVGGPEGWLRRSPPWSWRKGLRCSRRPSGESHPRTCPPRPGIPLKKPITRAQQRLPPLYESL